MKFSIIHHTSRFGTHQPKKTLAGRHFRTDGEGGSGAWLAQVDTFCYTEGIKNLLHCYQKCIDRNSVVKCVEK